MPACSITGNNRRKSGVAREKSDNDHELAGMTAEAAAQVKLHRLVAQRTKRCSFPGNNPTKRWSFCGRSRVSKRIKGGPKRTSLRDLRSAVSAGSEPRAEAMPSGFFGAC